jgi:hypothetical protein
MKELSNIGVRLALESEQARKKPCGDGMEIKGKI